MTVSTQFMLNNMSEASTIVSPGVADYAQHSWTMTHDLSTVSNTTLFVVTHTDADDAQDAIVTALQSDVGGVIVAQSIYDKVRPDIQAQLDVRCCFYVMQLEDALVRLARAWRRQFTYPVVAIAGSVGKTTVQRLVAHVLHGQGTSFFVADAGDHSIVALACALLQLNNTHEGALFEIGFVSRDDMRKRAQMVMPSLGLLTNVGHVFVPGIDNTHDIAHELRQLFAHFAEHTIGIINGDELLWSSISYAHPVIRFGCKKNNQLQMRKQKIVDNQIHGVIKIYDEKYAVVLPYTRRGMVYNVLAAASICYQLGVPTRHIIAMIEQPMVPIADGAYKKLTAERGIIIDDTYHASPEGVKDALMAFHGLKTGKKKIVVLGDIPHLGVHSCFWHRQIGRFLSKISSVKRAILVGSKIMAMKKTMPLHMLVSHVPTWQDAVSLLQHELEDDTVVLVKGATHTHLDKLVRFFT